MNYILLMVARNALLPLHIYKQLLISYRKHTTKWECSWDQLPQPLTVEYLSKIPNVGRIRGKCNDKCFILPTPALVDLIA
jgi:hypothetical protein